MFDDTEMRQTLQECLRRVPDLRRYGQKFQKATANLRDLVALYDFVRQLPNILDAFEGHDGGHGALLEEAFVGTLRDVQGKFAKFTDMVEASVDMEMLAHGKYFINARFDIVLSALKETMDEVQGDIDGHYSDCMRDIGLTAKQLHLEEKDGKDKEKGFVYRVSRKDESKIRNKGQYEVLQTKKAGVIFTTRELKHFNRKYNAAAADYERSQGDLEHRAMEIAATYAPVLERAERVLAELDVLVAFAAVGVNAPTPYVRPKMKECGSGEVHLKACRHPCVEVMIPHRPSREEQPAS